MGVARKYILTCIESKASGVTTVTNTIEYDLRESFSGYRESDGSFFEYSSIESENLLALSNDFYEQRVSDFLTYVGVATTAERTTLLGEASFDDVTCD